MASNKIKENRIVVECYLDTMILYALGVDPNHIHQGFSGVAHTMRDKISPNLKAIGIIDKDKAKNLPSYLNDFKLIEKDEDNQLEIYQLNDNRKLIKIVPAAEKWLEHCNNQLSKPVVVPYNNEIPKKETVLKDANVQNYINTIKQRKSPAYQKLEETIREFLGM